MDEDGPPRKIVSVDYPHCDQTVSKRTYRKHMALPATFEVCLEYEVFLLLYPFLRML